MKGNAVYAQSGGVTSVINASAYGVIKTAQRSEFIEKIYGGFNGINGILNEQLIDIQMEAPEVIEGLRYTPAGAFGSCRKKLSSLEKNKKEFDRILQVFEAHNIRFFFYNGGNDSMDTALKVSNYAKEKGYELVVIGIPKTVDNDLPITDNCPGFGSVAKYNAISIMEGAFDVASMHKDSTKVFVLETMGRHAGWIAAATGLAHRSPKDGPHIILLPERAFNKDKFYNKIEKTISKIGYCVIAVSEGIKDESGKFLAESGLKDSFGHSQLGGAGNVISQMIKDELKLKVHNALLDYCQRSGRHIASQVDVSQAIACGVKAVKLAEQEYTGKMVTIVRESNDPYQWTTDYTDIENIANVEKLLPDDYISEDGMHITEDFKIYCEPLIVGEDYPPYLNGLPNYVKLEKHLIKKLTDPNWNK